MEAELSSETKTDVSLLLKCLKFQMDDPESQKAALVTIYSICQGSTQACDHFREIGGLMFISNLAKCSPHPMVKEVSLFTLGVLAENNVFCQQALCTLELFGDICSTLSNEEASVNCKRMSVYVFLVLVSNNKTGQSFANISGCIDMLLILFREVLSLCSMHLPDLEKNQHYLLWTSVCSALCASANNPQNDENQKLCSSAFPQATDWLREYIQPEIVRPICSLVGLAVANNSFAQGYFASVGGLDTLAGVLVKLVADLGRSLYSKLAVAVTKTLDACVADNPTCVNCLSKHSIVTSLIRLLSHETLDLGDRFGVILALGHCTESCEANQYELLKSNGLPLMIQMLTESQDEELRKATTFVLQNCRQITEKLSVNLREPSPSVKSGSERITEKHMEECWKKAKEMLHKIEYLQQQHSKELAGSEDINCGPRALMHQLHPVALEQTDGRIPKSLSITEHFGRKDDHQVPAYPNIELKNHRLAIVPHSYNKDPKGLDERASVNRESVSLKKAKMQNISNTALQHNLAASTSSCSGETDSDGQAASLEKNAHSPRRDRSCESYTGIDNPLRDPDTRNTARPVKDKHWDCILKPSSELPQKAKHNGSRSAMEKEVLILRSRDDMFKNPASVTRERNTAEHIGCVATGTAMNSRNCSKILHRCWHLCIRHQAILQAEERYKKKLKSSASHNYSLTPLRKGGMSYEMFCQGKQNRSRKIGFRVGLCQGFIRTKTRRCAVIRYSQCCFLKHPGPGYQGRIAVLLPIPAATLSMFSALYSQNLAISEQKRGREKQSRRTRKDFTESEMAYLLDGVQKLGHRWNSILWSYPFQKGRRNVDLAKKYKKLKALS
ncbi:telomere repeats-binding bouquet formation protein 1 [Spea bombifrons]|uniref:telomere repeats-binding bouquet formation protein 1 n=1 Tax=Spea bombifrons TaxID=233779 RepID=UPI00234B076B|nr:telomere repeats-binding bouquet formation protein 1 [Spea bombifrons]